MNRYRLSTKVFFADISAPDVVCALKWFRKTHGGSEVQSVSVFEHSGLVCLYRISADGTIIKGKAAV